MPALLALFPWLGGVVAGLGAFLAGAFTTVLGWAVIWVVGSFVVLIDQATGWLSGFVTWAFGLVMDLVAMVATLAVNALPEASPEAFPVVDLTGLVAWFGWANRYVPLAEAFALMVLYSIVYGGLAGVKIIRFIRGGG